MSDPRSRVDPRSPPVPVRVLQRRDGSDLTQRVEWPLLAGAPMPVARPSARLEGARARPATSAQGQDIVVRPRLIELIRQGLSGRLVIIAAGAGYGKSTGIAQALAGHGMPSAWVTCAARARSGHDLLRNVADALWEMFPGVGSTLAGVGPVTGQVEALVEEVKSTIVDEVVLVIDDVHELDGEAGVTALEALVHELPRNVHLILAGRTALPFPLGRTWLDGVTELGEREFAFTEEETAELLGTGEARPSWHRVRQLHRRSEGWVAALLLMARPGHPDSRDGASISSGAIFQYLADEVISSLPDDLRAFLETTAVLDRFDSGLAARVSGRADAAAIIETLLARRLLLIPLDDEGTWFRYHNLLSDHLRRTVARSDPRRLNDAWRAAAVAWGAYGNPLEAARCAANALEWDLVADVLSPVAEDVATGPDGEVLGALLENLPDEVVCRHPELLAARAWLLAGRVADVRTLGELERVLDALETTGDHRRAALGVFRLQQAMLATGTPPRERALVTRRRLRRLEPKVDVPAPVRILHAVAAAYARHFADAKAQLDAVEAARAPAPTRTYAAVVRTHYLGFARDGRPEAVAAMRDHIAVLSEQGGDPLAFLPWARMLLAYELLDLGRWSEVLDEADRIEHAARSRGMVRTPGAAVAWLRAYAHSGRGDLGAADVWLGNFYPGSASVGLAYDYRGAALAALLAAEQGHRDLVLTHVHRARGAMASFGEASDDPVFLCDLALALHRVSEPGLARSLARDAMHAASTIGATWQCARAALVSAEVTDDDDERDRGISRALELSAALPAGDLWSRRERRPGARALRRALHLGLGRPGQVVALLTASDPDFVRECARDADSLPTHAREQLAEVAAGQPGIDPALLETLLRDRDAGVRASARDAWTRVRSRPRAAVTIRTLGGLEVRRDGLLVGEAAFGRQKARALLVLLIARAGPVHREEIVEVLWPALPPERAAAALRTTLHDLRRALQPEIDAASPSTLVRGEGDAVGLALGDRDVLDADELERVSRARADEVTIGELLAAERLYGGTFLPEWPYEDLVAARRRELEEAYRVVLLRLARRFGEAGQHDEALPRWERLVGLEPERESWHRELMRAYEANGDRALALRQFHACRAVLRRTQGVEPGATTRDLYRWLLTHESP